MRRYDIIMALRRFPPQSFGGGELSAYTMAKYLVKSGHHVTVVTGEEKGLDTDGRCIVAVDPRYFRPSEVQTLLGDATKAREKLGWTPKTSFYELIAEMAREDLKAAEKDELVKRHGYDAYHHNE